MEQLISIIVPVYNAEKTISCCIDSIIAQTYANWEAILIDDGSSDESGHICDEYAKKDKRFCVIHQQNCGASTARNIGIEHANGEWITFVDADDYIDNNYLIDLKTGITSNSALIIQGLKQIKDGKLFNSIVFEDGIIEKKDFKIAFEEKKIFEYGYSVAKLYNTQIIKNNHIRFNKDISYSEDLIFMLEYILYCDYINYIDGANYNYIVDNSILSQRYNSFKDEYRLFIEFNNTINKICNTFRFNQTKEIQQYSALILIRSILSLYKKNKYNRQERLNHVNYIKGKYYDYIQKYYTPKIIFLKGLKKLLLTNTILFDYFCTHKFK